MQRYGEAKARARRARLRRSGRARRRACCGSSAAVEWVLYKLDGGLDHILVDEAQDTSPVQWEVIRALAEEFFSGAGAQRGGAHAVRRRRREAVDLRLPGRGAQACSPRTGEALRRARRAAPACRGGACRSTCRSARSSRCWRRSTASSPTPERTPGVDCVARADRARRPSRRARRAGRDLADREARGSRRAPSPGRRSRRQRATLAGGAAGRAHRRHHRRLARSRARCSPRRTGRSAPATS